MSACINTLDMVYIKRYYIKYRANHVKEKDILCRLLQMIFMTY